MRTQTLRLTVRSRKDISPKTVELYFEFDGKYFPQLGWMDIEDTPLSWSQGLDKYGSLGTLSFLDGPFAFDVQENNGEYLFRFFDKYCENVNITSFQHTTTKTDYEFFRASLKTFMREHKKR